VNAETVERVFRAMKRACGRDLCLEAFVVEYGPDEPGPLARCRTCGKRWAVTETGMRPLPETVSAVSGADAGSGGT